MVRREERLPERLGRYVVRSALGRGGMGAVYLAHDPALDREVAIKHLFETDAVLLKRFRREAQALARITHPAIVAVHDLGEEDGRLFFVMELVPGQSLDRLLRERGALSEAHAARIARDVAEGMGVAHSSGIIHRDLKPSNLVIEPSGRVRLVDFGIARMSGHATLTQQDQLIGTPGFMAPEQAFGRAVDRRADIFALGLTLFAMLAGRNPFAGSDRLQVIRRTAVEPLPDLRTLRPGVSAELVTLTEQMAAHDPDARPSTMEDVCARLGELRLSDAQPPIAAPLAVALSATTPRLPPSNE